MSRILALLSRRNATGGGLHVLFCMQSRHAESGRSRVQVQGCAAGDTRAAAHVL